MKRRHAVHLLVGTLAGFATRAAAAEPEPGAGGLDSTVKSRALLAFSRAKSRVKNPLLTIIDYDLPSTKRRLWVLEPATGNVLFHELVAHGKGSGDDRAVRFGNEPGSERSSLGVFLTAETYQGRHGYSLKLDGLEPGFNDRARDREIVFHAADYVSDEFAKKVGRLGRSWGCPALDPAVAKSVIDRIKGGSLVVIYASDETWLSTSEFVNPGETAARAVR